MGLTHGPLASDSYYAQSSGAGDTGTYATPTSPSPSPQPTTPTPVVSPTTYSAPTPDTLARADYTKPSDLGDTSTQRLMVETGGSVEQVLKIQADNAKDARAKAYYENELRKALQSNISLASDYHSKAMKSGLAVAPNPFENVSDLSLKAVGSGSFKLGSYNDLDVDAVAMAKSAGDVGQYNTKNLQSYSSTYGVLPIETQQDIGRLVASTRPDLKIDESQLALLPVPKDFGYGGKKYVSSSYIQDQINAPSPVPEAVVNERKLPALSGGKINDAPFVMLKEAPAYQFQDNLFAGSAATVALGTKVDTEKAQLGAMTAGKLNEQGQFTGSAEEFAAITALEATYKNDYTAYESALSKDYENYKAIGTPSGKIYITGAIPKEEFAPKPQKNLFEQGIENINKNLDIGGGFIRAVGGITETPWTPNIVDAVTTIPKAIDKYTGVKVFGSDAMLAANPIFGMVMREGAEERPATGLSATSDTLRYGSYTEASDDFSRNVLQPVFGSPAVYAGHADYWEKKFKEPNATAGEKFVSGSMLVGAKANEYLLKNPGDIPVIATQAAAIEVTGAFAGIGRLGEWGIGKAASYIPKAAVDKYPLISTVVKGTGKFVGEHAVGLGFGTIIAGETTKTEEGWFRQTEPTEILKNIGPLGVQLVTFTAGTYGAPKSINTADYMKFSEPLKYKQRNLQTEAGKDFTGKGRVANDEMLGKRVAPGKEVPFDAVYREASAGSPYGNVPVEPYVYHTPVPGGSGWSVGGSGGLGGKGKPTGSFTKPPKRPSGGSPSGGSSGGYTAEPGGGFKEQPFDGSFGPGSSRGKTGETSVVSEGTPIKDTIQQLKDEIKMHQKTGGIESEMLIKEAEGRIKALENKLAKGQTHTGGGAGQTMTTEPAKSYAQQFPDAQATGTAKPADVNLNMKNINDMFGKPTKGSGTSVVTQPTINLPDVTPPVLPNVRPTSSVGKPTPPGFDTPVKEVNSLGKGKGVTTDMESGGYSGSGRESPPKRAGGELVKYSSDTGAEGTMTRGQMISIGESFPPKNTVTWLEKYYEKAGKEMPVSYYEKVKTDLMEYKKPKTDLMEYKKPKTDIVEYRAKPKDLVEYKAKPKSIMEYKPPKTDLVLFKKKPVDVVPFKRKPTDIVPFEKKPTDIVPFKRKPTDIVPFKEPVRNPFKPTKGSGEWGKYEPKKLTPPPKEGGAGGVIPPFGGLDTGGGGGGGYGGGGGGSRHGFMEVFRYGFGLKTKGSKLPPANVKVNFAKKPKTAPNVITIKVKSVTPQKVSVARKRK